MSQRELQVRLPYTAWGDGDEWQAGYEELMCDLDVEVLVRAVVPVLEAHGLRDQATGFLTDPEAKDFEVGTVIPLRT